EQVAAQPQRAGSVEQKVADYYRSYMDTKAIDAAGLKPFEGDFARINGLKSYEDIAALVADPGFAANSPVVWGITIDEKNPDRYAFIITQGGLGLPDRDYYLKPDQKFAETRTAYRTYIEKMLSLAKYPNAKAAADSIMAVEMKIAEIQWPIEQQ